MPTTPRPTLESVARHAGVSRQTVSNVINSPQLVRDETMERVRAAIDELGYRPSAAARQLRTRRSNTVGLRLEQVRDGINGAVLDRFLHALTDTAQEHGYRVVLFTAADDHAEIEQYTQLLDTADLDAFVLTSTHRGDPRATWLTEHQVPFVTFGRPWTSPTGDDEAVTHPWVDIDGAAGTEAATRHLLDLGHRDIAFLGWPDGSDTGDDRAAGWAAAMTAAGTSAADLRRLRVQVPDSVPAGAQATERVLADASPTALVCASDSLALGALTVARQVDPPVAVIGFDDTPVAAAIGLTSVAQPLVDVARRAFGLLLAQIDPARPATDTQVLLTPHLVPRASTRTAP